MSMQDIVNDAGMGWSPREGSESEGLRREAAQGRSPESPVGNADAPNTKGEGTKEGATPASAAEPWPGFWASLLRDVTEAKRQLDEQGFRASYLDWITNTANDRTNRPVDPAPASAVPAAKPAAWMNPRESFAPRAFIWNADERHPEYSVAVYASAPVAPGVAQDAARWISVDERKPPKYEEVLIAFRDTPLPATGQYTASPHDTWGWSFPSENDPEDTGPITHWMPLPEPPSSPVEPTK
jgi:hypothetical protein